MLSDEKYMLFTTYRRSGTPVPTPVWVVGLGADRVGFMTGSKTGKAKRLAHTSRVVVQPCNVRGKVKSGSTPIDGTARLVTGEEMEAVRVLVRTKYPVVVKLMGVLRTAAGVVGRRSPESDRGVVVTLGAAA